MFENKRNWLARNWFNLFYIIVALTAFVFLTIYYAVTEDGFVWSKLWPLLLKEAGIAMLIAIVLIYTIEGVSRKRHEDAVHEQLGSVNKSIFQAVYKRYIPEVVFQEVERCLLKNYILRKNYQINYTLREVREDDIDGLENAEDYFVCEIYISYVLANMTNTEKTEEIAFSLEVPNEAEIAGFTSISSFQINDEEFINEQQTANVNGACKFTKERKIAGDAEIRVNMQGKTIKRKIDSESLSSLLPSESIRISVNAPEGTDVQCNSNHSQDIKRMTPEQASLSVWELNYGIFPYQSFVIYWNGRM